MKLAHFSTKRYDEEFFRLANREFNFQIDFLEPRLTPLTAGLAHGHDAVCAFVNDDLSADTLVVLRESGVRFLGLRCAGYNNLDVDKLRELGLRAVRVPAYSPHAVAEHTLGLILALNRRLYRAYNRVRENNFSLDGLLGFDLQGKTAGIIGTGQIGEVVVKLLQAFGCRVLCHDIQENPNCLAVGAEYVSLAELYREADIISLHCPLLPATHHTINAESLALMKDGVMIVNTSRGALIDTEAVIAALKSRKIAHLGLDVYEQETNLFFQDLSHEVITDDTFQRLLTFPNVMITGHQAFFTQEALTTIAQTTLKNLFQLNHDQTCENEIC